VGIRITNPVNAMPLFPKSTLRGKNTAAAPHLGEPKFAEWGIDVSGRSRRFAVPKVDMFSLRCYERRMSGRGSCCSWSHKLLSQFHYQLSQCKQEPKKTSSCLNPHQSYSRQWMGEDYAIRRYFPRLNQL